MEEIERKWLLKTLPEEVKEQQPIKYERHFIFNNDGIEIRIQKKGDTYEFERKVESSTLTRTAQKFEISEDEFNTLKKAAIASLERESFKIQTNPEISIKVYQGKYEGLIRAEIEFTSEDEARNYTPPTWFGPEITNSDLGKDKNLIALSNEEFKTQLQSLLTKSSNI